jgi:transcription initiation factor IIE alpha subunit
LAKPGSCRVPLHQGQIGETLGMSIVTVNRTLQALRRSRTMEFRNGELTVFDWKKLVELGDFDPGYLQLKRPSRM